MKKKENKNSFIIRTLEIKPVVYNPVLAEISGSVIAGVLMSQLLYWHGKGKSNWIYKTIEEFYEETRLSRSEQDRAIKIWNNLNCLFIKIMGVPPKRHFYIEFRELSRLFEKITGFYLPLIETCVKCQQSAKLHEEIKHKQNCIDTYLLKPTNSVAETNK